VQNRLLHFSLRCLFPAAGRLNDSFQAMDRASKLAAINLASYLMGSLVGFMIAKGTSGSA
jgi:hypothetical protein